ncbi:hypothetical protein JAAARDRAFT_117782 [Jaapia argillacea MUCL 33604]|uniref:HIT-type domain-containing protein n=1 Tax=Jaapia argillacea MUCL 33604 TaxID=933084 RepID=A0A067QCH0_9AGAM|nr:hypothetical protein JAAARDRAFT_117782 [Jaapia argillacea MUCL 33604]
MAETILSLPEASTSAKPLHCAICNNESAIYTCPRCAVRSCSAQCSASHKVSTGCSGVRNKAAYVPINQYSWGTMMDDYVFLEEVGRKVGEWGKQIGEGGLAVGSGDGGRGGRGAMSMRSRGRGRGGMRGSGRTKRDVLKMQLDFRDIDMEGLPTGMAKRKLNQSTWDFKNKTGLLTIEFKFHRPRDPSAPSSQPPEPPLTLLTHRNSLDSTLWSIIQQLATQRGKSKKEDSPTSWLKSLVYPDPDDPESFTPPSILMPATADSLPSHGRDRLESRGYYRVDPTQQLETVLRFKSFVEFPTFEVWEDGAFAGIIIDGNGEIQRDGGEDRRPKRRKMNLKEGRTAISGLLAGYGSEGGEDDGEDMNVLDALGEYAESGEDEEQPPFVRTGGSEGPHEQGDGVEDYNALIEKIRLAQKELGESDDAEELDWSDS